MKENIPHKTITFLLNRSLEYNFATVVFKYSTPESRQWFFRIEKNLKMGITLGKGMKNLRGRSSTMPLPWVNLLCSLLNVSRCWSCSRRSFVFLCSFFQGQRWQQVNKVVGWKRGGKGRERLPCNGRGKNKKCTCVRQLRSLMGNSSRSYGRSLRGKNAEKYSTNWITGTHTHTRTLAPTPM